MGFKLQFSCLGLLVSLASSHSWVECFNWKFRSGRENRWNDDDGVCEGFTRRWPVTSRGIQDLQVDYDYEFWMKEGEVRDNQFCKTTLRNDDDEITEKRADPPAAAYDGEWESMASVKVGDPLCIKWPAKNHKTHVDSDVKTSSFGERVTSKQVFVYVARTTNEPGDWHDSAQAQRFELEFANCPDPGPSTGDRDAEYVGSNLAGCGGCITVPSRPQGVYSIAWEWYGFTTSYVNCGDMQISPAASTPTQPPPTVPPPTPVQVPPTSKPVDPFCDQSMTASELGMHSASGDCYMAIDGTVFDMTIYLNEHPAGPGTMVAYCGKDASQGFYNIGSHPRTFRKNSQKWVCKGQLASAPPPTRRPTPPPSVPDGTLAPTVYTATVEVEIKIRIQRPPSEITLQWLMNDLSGAINVPYRAFTKLAIIFDESDQTSTVCRFTLTNHGDSDLDPVAAAQKLQNFADSGGATAGGLLMGIQVLDDSSPNVSSSTPSALLTLHPVFALAWTVCSVGLTYMH